MRIRAKQHWENNKNKYNEKIPCDICGVMAIKRLLPQHKNTIKCQSYTPNRAKATLAEKTPCDKCGKVVWNVKRHKETLECKYFPDPVLIAEKILRINADKINSVDDVYKFICSEFEQHYKLVPGLQVEGYEWDGL